MPLSNYVSVNNYLYLESQAVLAAQAAQNLPYSLEILQARTLLLQGRQVVLVCLQALVDLGSQGLHPPLGRDTTQRENMLKHSGRKV